MDTAWIQVFVLTLSECVAPSGKTVCQQQETQYVFFNRRDCEAVLSELVKSKANDETVIVDPDRSRCLPSARQQPVYASKEEANQQLADVEGWGIIPAGQEEAQQQPGKSSSRMAYLDRLESLPECDAERSVTPCRAGQIIVESPAEEDQPQEVPIWQKQEN